MRSVIFQEEYIMKEKVVLAYSGGLDTKALIPWLKETFVMINDKEFFALV